LVRFGYSYIFPFVGLNETIYFQDWKKRAIPYWGKADYINYRDEEKLAELLAKVIRFRKGEPQASRQTGADGEEISTGLRVVRAAEVANAGSIMDTFMRLGSQLAVAQLADISPNMGPNNTIYFTDHKSGGREFRGDGILFNDEPGLAALLDEVLAEHGVGSTSAGRLRPG